MERSIVAVEENHQRVDSTNGASSSLGLLVKIDSISIDLGITMEKKDDIGDKCRQFTIRGYVEEMRKKDSKLCDPFSFFREDSNAKEQVPSLAASNCRRWECHKCPQETGKASLSEEIGGAISQYNEGRIISGSSYIQRGNAASDQSHLSETQALVNYERMENNLIISAHSKGNEIKFLSDKKRKYAKVLDPVMKGHGNVSEDDANQEVSEFQVPNQRLINEGHTDFAVPRQSKSSKPAEISDTNSELLAAGTLLAIEYHKYGFTEKVQKISSLDVEQRNLLINYNMPEECSKQTEKAKVDKGKSILIPSLDEQEFETASPENEEVIVEDNDNNTRNPENSGGIQKRKPQKVRLLAELLGSKKNDENIRTAGGCSNAALLEATIPAINPNVLLQDRVLGTASLGTEKKRKAEEEKKTIDCSWLKNVGKKVRTLKGDEDLIKAAIEISDSETEDIASLGVRSKSKKHGDRTSIFGQRKTKQAEFADSYLPIGSWGDVSIPKANHSKAKDGERTGVNIADSSFLRSVNDPSKNMSMDPYYKNYFPLQHYGKESSGLSKKKSKTPQVAERQTFLMPPSFLQNGSQMLKSQTLNNDASTALGLDLSLNGLMAADRKDKNPSFAQASDKNGFLLPRPKATSFKERLNYDFNQKTAHGTAMHREQQNRSPRLDDEIFSARHNLDLSGPSNSKRPTDAHNRIEPVREHSDQRAGKLFESQRNSEEIPMEIVELMAKNQYERALSEAEKNNYRRNNNKRPNSDMIMGFPNKGQHGNGVMRILPKEYPSMRKPPPTHGMIPPGEDVNKANHVSFFSPDHRSRFSMAVQEENPGIKMFDAFSPNIQFQNSFQNDKPEKFWSFRPPQVTEDCSSNRNLEKNKEKVVRGFDLNHVALHTSNFSCPNPTPASEPWMSMAYRAPAREQRGPSDQNPKPIASSFVSLNSQDAIPAMQLLSLMDAGMNKSKAFDVDPKRVLEKPFYPCRNHPSFIMEKPPLTQCTYNAKSAFQGVGSGVVYKAGESSKQMSSLSSYGKIQNSETACFCAADPFVPLFQTDRNSKRLVGSDNRIFFKPQEQEKERRLNPTPQRKPRKYVKHGSGPPPSVLGKQKGVAAASNAFSSRDLAKRKNVDESYRQTIVSPVNLTLRNDHCSLNRNPADFTVPGDHNQFMISGEQLAFSKKVAPKFHSNKSR